MTTTTKVANLATLDELASQLNPNDQRIELGLRSRWNASRREQGLVLKSYQNLYKPQRLWKKFLAVVGIVERTAYRMIEDAAAVSGLPAAVIEEADSRGFDLAEHKYRSVVAAIKEQLTDVGPDAEQAAKIISNVIPFPAQLRSSDTEGTKSPVAPKPQSSLEDFAARTVRTFEARYQGISQSVRDDEVQYVFELVNATLRSSVRELRQYERPALVPKPPLQKEQVA